MNAAGRSSPRGTVDATERAGFVAADVPSGENRTSMDEVALTPEGELARRARLGDRAAFDALYTRFARGVHAVLATRVPASEAEDLVQDVFVLAWRARGELREPDRVGPWLFAIARREAGAARRDRVDAAQLPDDLAAPDTARSAERDEAEHVLAVLRTLPEAYRETLSLRLLGDYSGVEIARLTGMTHGSVRVNLHKGLEMLREKLSRATTR